ncbi:MAG: DUF4160 domain-containing protein [Nitrospirae bacterium]|nr:DUF4160 domain-containing protein [Nitrospirota bacterium]
MPTILLIMGWRFFFYANEREEPAHVHCKKADMECKYWLDPENYALEEAYAYNMNNKDKRDVKRIIYEYFEYIESEWIRFQKEARQ